MKNDAMQRRAGGVKLSSIIFCVTVLVAGLPTRGRAQVNSGSDGSTGEATRRYVSTGTDATGSPAFQILGIQERSLPDASGFSFNA